MIVIASIFVFCLAATFRLLDNSAALLISHGISVSPFYLSPAVIREEMLKADSPRLTKRLRITLFFQKLHWFFVVLSILMFLGGSVYEIISPTIFTFL